ncbi:tgtA5 cluster protein 3 [Actinokineospora spheciospongiae]|uniref:TgtA5 cluster protein 3 n=1 Tax=Actinokineospora spheciospongiae TaxID=909613 RepID=W7J504_9PSEU|nr:protein DpdD [Actinokineospora spheciospongiae]EWC64097.1 tgtA5 cluster protein 3 [Actinokineospora spheciospongiae]
MDFGDTIVKCGGDLDRFRVYRRQVQILLDEQLQQDEFDQTGWLIVPLHRVPDGFYLLSRSREGHRRGKEVLKAFFGAAAEIDSASLAPGVQQTDLDLSTAGLQYLSTIKRVRGDQDQFIRVIEDIVATVKGRDVSTRSLNPSYIHLLRDFRLGLRQNDAKAAERALEALELTGTMSAENIRFLVIQMLGNLGRWAELQALPYLGELLRTRRPRAINEVLLEMIWRSDLATTFSVGPITPEAFDESNLVARYGSVVGAVDVPVSWAGRCVAAVAAVLQDDARRADRLLSAAEDDVERERLTQLMAPLLDDFTQPVTDMSTLFEQGQYHAVIAAFLEHVDASTADLAVQAVLDCEDTSRALAVFEAVRGLADTGGLVLGRRLKKDLDDLKRLADETCASWLDWCTRVAQPRRWPEAEYTLRSAHSGWSELKSLSPGQASAVAYALLDAWAGSNSDQVTASLDLLCQEAATPIANIAEFRDVVLQILAEQGNLSLPVRNAYLELFGVILSSGPSAEQYEKSLEHALKLWDTISAPTAADWAIAIMDMMLEEPTPQPGMRLNAIHGLIGKLRNLSGQRLSHRQSVEIEALAEEVGLPARKIAAPVMSADVVWGRLNGTVIGLYSLLPHAARLLENRLLKLCRPAEVVGNADTVSTEALIALVDRADHLIVDVRHAAHAATVVIDSRRPKSKQILPQGRGVSSFIQAIERSLAEGDVGANQR